MRVFERGAAVFAFAALLLPTIDRASADELLVMPYACTVVSGQPVLSPGPEQSHRIIGQRDQRKFTACSPVNPGMCRHWTVHRFDLDCGGKRVSWVSVVAATNEGSRRAWLLDGRMLLRMGPWWSLAPDDPCAREAGPDERSQFGARLRRQCGERLAMAPPPVVEMPFGYAPMLGIDGIFVTAAPQASGPAPGGVGAPSKLPPIVAAPPSAKSATADAKPQAAPDLAAELWPEAEREPTVKEAQPAPPPPAPVPPAVHTPKVASAAPPVATPPPAAEEPVRKADPKPAPKVAAAVPAKEAPQGSQGPRIVTPPPPPAPPTTDTAPQSPPSPKVAAPATPAVSEVQKKAPSAEPSPAPKAAAAVPASKTEQVVAPAKPTESDPEAAVGPSLLSLFRTTTTGAIVAFAGLALGLLTAFALARRREHSRDVGRRRRDISSLSLDAKQARAAARAGGEPQGRPGRNIASNASTNPAPAGTAVAMPRSVAAGEAADWHDRMPRTREEALEVLGIGIAPSATETAIKKIVDGLRMSWHPDLAKDETDRALREVRSKQINAAWDILQGQRAEV